MQIQKTVYDQLKICCDKPPFYALFCLFVILKAVSDDTIFAHDCLRFASRAVGRNLTQSCAIGLNLT